MSKKKKLILILIILFFVGFFFPKKANIGDVECMGCVWHECDCSGLKVKLLTNYICFGIVTDCEIKETETSFFEKNSIRKTNGVRLVGGNISNGNYDNAYYEYNGKIAFCAFFNRQVCWILENVDVATFEYLGREMGEYNYYSDYAKDKNGYYKDWGTISLKELPENLLK